MPGNWAGISSRRLFCCRCLRVLGLLARFRRDAGLCFAIFAIFPVLLFTLNLGAIEVVFNIKSARQLAQQIPPLPPETGLAFLECFPNGLPFYLNRTATLITTGRQRNYEFEQLYFVPAEERSRTGRRIWCRSRNLNDWLAAAETSGLSFGSCKPDRFQLEAVAGIQKTNIQQLTPQYVGVLLPAP